MEWYILWKWVDGYMGEDFLTFRWKWMRDLYFFLKECCILMNGGK